MASAMPSTGTDISGINPLTGRIADMAQTTRMTPTRTFRREMGQQLKGPLGI